LYNQTKLQKPTQYKLNGLAVNFDFVCRDWVAHAFEINAKDDDGRGNYWNDRDTFT
jgi:hypothetical protein